jgi:hypothetical protein
MTVLTRFHARWANVPTGQARELPRARLAESCPRQTERAGRGVAAARGPTHAYWHRGCVSTRRCRTQPVPYPGRRSCPRRHNRSIRFQLRSRLNR